MIFISIFKRLPVQRRVMQILYGAILCIGAMEFLSGKPPAHAQIATEAVVTQKDESQDISLSKLQEFKINQEAWNAQTGKEVAANSADVTKLYAGIATIMGLAAIGVGFQYKGMKRA